MKQKFIFIVLVFIALFAEPLYYFLNSDQNLPARVSNVNGKISIIFRNDDLGLRTDLNKETKILNIFSFQGIKPIYAIIPTIGNRSLSKQDAVIDSLRYWISQSKIIPTLYGYNHEVNKYGGREFKYLNYNEQYIKIKSGRKLCDSLLKTNVNIFVPPWNQADINTIMACYDNDIKIFSGYLNAPVIAEMFYINSTNNLFGGPLGGLSDAIKKSKSNVSSKALCVLFHTSYDFEEENISILDSFLTVLYSDTNILFPDPELYIYSDINYLNNVNKSFGRHITKGDKLLTKGWVLNKFVKLIGFDLSSINRQLEENYKTTIFEADYKKMRLYSKKIFI